jgi:outer membrane protein OmpA-like peptidoglycan-associated protein
MAPLKRGKKGGFMPMVESFSAHPLQGPLQTEAHPIESRPWIGLSFAFFIGVISALWVYQHNQYSLAAQEATNYRDSEMIPASEALPQTLDTLEEFLNAPALGELPKRFRFETLNFESGTTRLMPGSEAELEEIITAMRQHPAARARLEGFTDNTGDTVTNLQLSEQRAEAVKSFLVARGVAADHLEAIGRGADSPITSNISADGRTMNRRIEFIVTQVR